MKVSWFTFNGPTAVNEALISGNIDVGSGGVPGLLVLWSRTKGTPQEVRGISALSSQPFLLNSRDPAIKTIKDFKDSDRIAVPAVRSSVQAITLQMAAAKTYGTKEFDKLDPLTVSMTPPRRHSRAAQGRRADLRCVQRAAVPVSATRGSGCPHRPQLVRRDGQARTPSQLCGRRRNSAMAIPVLYKALVAALKEATEIVNKDKVAAAALWIEDLKSKLPLDMVGKIVAGPQVRWTLTPENTMKYADFMAEVGTLKTKPESWKDYFFPEIHDEKGS